LFEGGLFQPTLMGITLAPTVYRERRFLDCRIKGWLVSKPVDFSLRPRPDLANVSLIQIDR